MRLRAPQDDYDRRQIALYGFREKDGKDSKGKGKGDRTIRLPDIDGKKERALTLFLKFEK